MRKSHILLIVFFLSCRTISLGQSPIDLNFWWQTTCSFDDTVCSDWFKFPQDSLSLWEIGRPSSSNIFKAALSIPNALLTDSNDSYPVNNHSYFDFVIPVVDMGGTWIQFKHKLSSQSGRDGGYITRSLDGGISWVNILQDTVHDLSNLPYFLKYHLYSSKDTLFNGEPGFSGLSTEWDTVVLWWQWNIPLKVPVDSLYEPDTFMLRFHFISDSIPSSSAKLSEGWMIDDLILGVPNMGTGIAKSLLAIKVKLSPNPATNHVLFTLDEEPKSPLDLEIFQCTGTLAHRLRIIRNSHIRFDTQKLESGLYFYRFSDKDGIKAIGKFIKR
jgi:hypothetical protein